MHHRGFRREQRTARTRVLAPASNSYNWLALIKSLPQDITMMHTLLAAALVPLALGDYSYSFTDAPTAAPTTLTASPTSSMAPTRTETYAVISC